MREEFKLPETEEKILKFWEKNRIFEKTLAARKGKRRFIFYEGPPYANGKPGIHHVLARVVKDVILRYKTMRGYYVPRRAGWDTHGLPVEMAAEKALGLKSKKDIEKFGVKLFNKKAREQVWIYKDEWEEMTRRIGYWLDLKNAYVTYETEYIETIWWTIKQIAKRGLLYKGHKVVPWCTRCGTALSSHELALGYKEAKDNSLYVKFRLQRGQDVGGYFKTDEDAYILSWTTTPWTLPGNVALAVGAEIKYAVLKKMLNGKIERWIVAEDMVKKEGNPVGSPFDVKDVLTGAELAGLAYEPLFDVPSLRSPNSYRIYTADFVNTEEGTGVVHTAVMYGEDDYRLGVKVGLPQRHTVGEDGKFVADVRGLSGMYVKAEETEEKILEHLRRNGNLLKIQPYLHDYPYCWRCETPILYYARTSWFIAMSKLRGKLLANNRKINWMPEHLKGGRFGEWLKDVKDWNLSRERYWGAPLPVWECKKCGKHEVLGSLEELSERAGGSKNKYWAMRHGEAKGNAENFIDSGGAKENALTAPGRSLAERSVKNFLELLKSKKEKIDLVISSDILRTKQTAEIAGNILGVKKVIFDRRLREINLGPALQGCHDEKYHELLPTYESKFEKRLEGGESLRDLRARVWALLQELEKKHRGKNILLVSHEYPVWMLAQAAEGWNEKRSIGEKIKRGEDFINVGEIIAVNFRTVPRDDRGEPDLHRPYADLIAIPCRKCGGKARRIKEIADVWYDSGAMPYAQAHWPFSRDARRATGNKKSDRDAGRMMIRGLDYPADYIAEGMDQTRGWFYTLLAIATALGCGAPYKNVISLGLINDKHGRKMSKSKGNVVNPWEVVNKYGADAVRWYFYTLNSLGETKNFDENEISRAYRRMHLLLWNSLIFYKTYAGKKSKIKSQKAKRGYPLDEWILARLEEAAANVTKKLDKYGIREAALAAESLVDDLSRWYIRRSRRRLQRPSSGADFAAAAGTLGSVLRETAKLIAPFTPFFAEALWAELGNPDSVHLENWPEQNSKLKNEKLLKAMAEVRQLASLGLARRAEAGIKVRQPLSQARFPVSGSRLPKAMLDILKDEINVKSVVFDGKLKKGEIELDTEVTPALKEEGILREVIRAVQDLRQKAGLKPKDKIILTAEFPAEIRLAIYKNEKLLKSEVGAKNIEYKKSAKFDAEEAGKIDNYDVWLAVRKI